MDIQVRGPVDGAPIVKNHAPFGSQRLPAMQIRVFMERKGSARAGRLFKIYIFLKHMYYAFICLFKKIPAPTVHKKLLILVELFER